MTEVRAFFRHDEDEKALLTTPFDEEDDLNVDDEFRLFVDMCDVLFELRRFPELQRATFSALGSPRFNRKSEMAREIEFLCLLSSYLNGDGYHAYNLVRELVVNSDLKNNRAWNLFNLVISKADDLRHNRFLMRLLSKAGSDNVALGVLNGHNCLISGTYKYSLGEYMTAFKQEPDNPLIALMLGLSFTHMACQKFSAKKHSLVVQVRQSMNLCGQSVNYDSLQQACAFLNQYVELRGHCQESYYNVGRAMHQLGLLTIAIHYYKKGLNSNLVPQSERFDLTKELAFNLSLIYESSGSHDLALMYLRKHIVV